MSRQQRRGVVGRRWSVLMLCVLASVGGVEAAPEPGPACEAGVSDLRNFSVGRDGSMVESAATSTRLCAFAGQARVDEFRALDDGGQVIFRGVSLEVPSEDGASSRILWLMVGDPGLTVITTRTVDGVIQAEGKGIDGLGTFDERSRTTPAADGTTEFVMDRHYQRIGRWIAPFNRILTTPTDRPLSAPPAEAQPPLLEGRSRWPVIGTEIVRRQDWGSDGARRAGTETTRSRFILDGFAILSEVEWVPEGDDAALRRWFRFALVDVQPLQWRVMEWDLAADDVHTRTTALRGSAAN